MLTREATAADSFTAAALVKGLTSNFSTAITITALAFSFIEWQGKHADGALIPWRPCPAEKRILALHLLICSDTFFAPPLLLQLPLLFAKVLPRQLLNAGDTELHFVTVCCRCQIQITPILRIKRYTDRAMVLGRPIGCLLPLLGQRVKLIIR